jgi:predicted nucleic acid-binding protein
MAEVAAVSTLAAFQNDLEQQVWEVAALDWERALSRAEQLMIVHTPRHGARSMDLLHIAAALELGASEFLSFDENQSRVATLAGLTVRSKPTAT